MKHLKTKLMASVVMLLIATVLMSTASYAWFTISTNPELKGLATTVVTNDNLEIALKTTEYTGDAPAEGDTGKYYTFGNLVDLGTYDGVIRPAALASNAFTAPSYGTDGRPDDIDAIVITKDTLGDDGVGMLKGTDGLVYGYYVSLKVRTNLADSKLSLTTATKRSSEGVDGEGSTFTTTNDTLRGNIGIAFQLDTGDITDATVDADSGVVTCSEFAELTQNTIHDLTVYVYLKGANVTNAAASITGTLVTGSINLQFTNGATTSMDATSGS